MEALFAGFLRSAWGCDAFKGGVLMEQMSFSQFLVDFLVSIKQSMHCRESFICANISYMFLSKCP